MTKPEWLLLVVAMVAVPATVALVETGCSSTTATGIPAPEAGLPGPTDGSSKTVSLKWVVVLNPRQSGSGNSDGGFARVDGGDGGLPGVAGAKVCAYQMPSVPCVMTDSDGIFTLAGLPPLADVLITFDKDGYRPIAQPVETASSDMDGTGNPLYMGRTSDPDPPIGGAVDWQNKGQVAFFVLGPNALLGDAGTAYVGDPGATVTVTPATGGIGPLFLTDQNTFDASAKTLIDLQGEAYNLDPGNYTMTLGDPNNDCEPISYGFGGWGYPGAAHQVNFPVIPGYTTGLVGELCTPNSTLGNDAGKAAPDASESTDASDAGASRSSGRKRERSERKRRKRRKRRGSRHQLAPERA